MTLSAQLSYEFDTRIRNRGLSYFRAGRVQIVRGSDDSVEARVRGALLYEVSLELTGHTLESSCSCPYFEDGGGCKHVWATILAAEARGFHRWRLEPEGHAGIRPHGAGAAQGAVKESWGHAREPQIEHRQSGVSPVSLTAPKPAPPKPPRWREHLSEIERRRESGRPAGAAWPERRQVLYVIDVSASRLTLMRGAGTVHSRPQEE